MLEKLHQLRGWFHWEVSQSLHQTQLGNSQSVCMHLIIKETRANSATHLTLGLALKSALV